jgi:hypothetical protein
MSKRILKEVLIVIHEADVPGAAGNHRDRTAATYANVANRLLA